MTLRIAVDAMGGDGGVAVTVPATVSFLNHQSDCRAVLVGDEAAISARLADQPYPTDRLTVQPAAEQVTMDEHPAKALRNKKNSSMRIAINLVQQGEADACVSAGNTGALMAISRFVLKTLSGIDRPAIVRSLPTLKGTTLVLDLGANPECIPDFLLQFSIMGSVLAKAVGGRENPRVGLLNIGTEESKGNALVQQAAEMIQSIDGINFHGFVEGNDIYEGTVDVVVCDGFTGNVALKTSEGLARMVSVVIREEFSRSSMTKLAALVSRSVLQSVSARLDSRSYNGASLLGLNGVVIKSHGGCDEYGFECALEEARVEGMNQVPDLIRKEVVTLLPGSQAA